MGVAHDHDDSKRDAFIEAATRYTQIRASVPDTSVKGLSSLLRRSEEAMLTAAGVLSPKRIPKSIALVTGSMRLLELLPDHEIDDVEHGLDREKAELLVSYAPVEFIRRARPKGLKITRLMGAIFDQAMVDDAYQSYLHELTGQPSFLKYLLQDTQWEWQTLDAELLADALRRHICQQPHRSRAMLQQSAHQDAWHVVVSLLLAGCKLPSPTRTETTSHEMQVFFELWMNGNGRRALLKVTGTISEFLDEPQRAEQVRALAEAKGTSALPAQRTSFPTELSPKGHHFAPLASEMCTGPRVIPRYPAARWAFE